MGFFDRFRSKAASARVEPVLSLFSPPWVLPPRRGTAELLAAYHEQPWLRAVVHKVSSNVAGTKWRLYRRGQKPGLVAPKRLSTQKALRDVELKALTKSGALTEVTDHPLLDLLTAPCADMSGRAMIEVLQTHLDLVGEGFLQLHRDSNGAVDGLFIIPPSWVTQLPTQTDPTYRVTPAAGVFGGAMIIVKREDMIFLREHDPVSPYGRGTGIAASLGDELETDEYCAKYLSAFFFNNASPAGIVGIDGGGINDAGIKKLKEEWESRHGGANNTNRMSFLTGKVSVTKLDSSFKDMAVVELRTFLRDMTRQVYGVPPEVMGIVENSSRTSATVAGQMFGQNVLTPRLEKLCAEFQHHLVPRFGRDLVLDYDSPVPADKELQLTVMKAQPNVFTKNEWRELAGFEPLSSLDGQFPELMPGQAQTDPVEEGGDPENEAAIETQ